LLPEINEKMGFHDTVMIDNNIIQHIIENYTCEPGVRKLKEIIFDMYGAINIELLENDSSEGQQRSLEKIPIHITESHLDKYLKKYKKIQDTKIHSKYKVGIMNGLWANSLGRGGIIPIEAMFFPTENFLELKLTGLQGDVMKESMNVAKTLVWSLCTTKQKNKIINDVKHAKTQGIHVHCPEGAISKDGPSAGTAIVVAIYSLLNNMPIRNDVGITGEICLQGNVTAIGGLDCKITGGIKAGIKTFIIPHENDNDLTKIIQQMIEQKYILDNTHVSHHDNKCEILYENKTITFISVSNIQEVLPYVFDTKK
jgi:ATP-dependent Lon protease